MPPAQLTDEQERALATRDVSVALSAGAGCGKTYVLTERFLSHLDRADPAELRQLIAITFTDAAAREMRSRIRDKCFERLQTAASAEEQERWLGLLREIDAARVSTIHSFCASLLRAHAAEAGLDPTFGVLDQGDADVLQYNVIDDVLRDQLEQLDEETLRLAAAYGLARLKQQIATLLGERQHDYFQTWQDAAPDELVDRWREWHQREALPNALREIIADAPIDEILALLRDIAPKKEKFCDARAGLLDLLPRLRSRLSADELQQVRDLARVQTICTAKDWPSTEDFGRYRDACKKLRDVLDEHRPKPFDPTLAYESAELGVALLRLTAKVADEYDRRKAAQGRLDFDDLLSRAYALIANPQNAALQARLADDLRLLLVDEFQDTDQLQVDLVKALCGPGFDTGRLFFVGDFKQSIYRFRGAAPKVFRDLRAQLTNKGRLPLNINFRSQPAILNFVNALFCTAFEQGDHEFEPLRPSRRQATSPAAVEFLWKITPDKNTGAKGATEQARREEARAIARRIRSLIDPSSDEKLVVDKQTGQPRPVQLGDVAILFRALSDVQLYEEALREQELDYYLVGGHAFYAQQEIYDVLNLLRAVASTADELSLAGVLRSPFFALEDETLFWLVDSGRSADFSPSATSDGLKSGLRLGALNGGLTAERLPPQLSPAERSKVTAAATTLRALRDAKDRVPVATLLGEAFARTGYDAVLLAEFLGERKLANLHKLLERARAADAGISDLDGFITQLAQFIAQEPKEALAATLPEAANVIRLMTIHHAKGLEFPLVIIPDLDRPPRLSTPCAALHGELGPLVPWPGDDDQKVATGMSLFAALERTEELEERKRLLYVACTRAADHLILSSSLEGYEKPKSDWMKLLGERFDLETGQLREELPPDYDAPSVRVVPEPHTDHKPAGKSRGPDLLQLLEEAHELAADGRAVVPPEVEPVPVDHAARRQFSFSRLSGQIVSSEAPPRQFMDDAAPSVTPTTDPRGLGSLVHDVLARLDFDNPNDIGEWCEHLASQHVLFHAEDAARQAREMLERFAASPRFMQLREAALVHRELEFLVAWPPGQTNGQTRYFRGYIDCLHQDAHGDWHLTDYKTNEVAAADVPLLAQQYELQLAVYAMATERALGRPPVELALHFLRPGVEQLFPWNDTTRERATDLVNQAIANTTEWSVE